jgi:enoyl-CoA hydratase/carnithine racemase
MTNSASTSLLGLERAGAVAHLTLNRPDQLNAIGTPTVQALHRALDDLANEDDIRAIVVAGAGRAFSAGADISEFEAFESPRQFRAFINRLDECFGRIQAFPKPSIAAIHGFAFGGGLELALACDLRVAARDARLGVPEMKLGLLPGAGATQRLPRLLPVPIAKQLVLTGEPLSGQRAYELGLVNEVTDGADVLTRATALAKVLAAGAPQALAAGKHLIDDGVAMSLDAAIHLERETVAGLFATEDRRIGVQAFRNRTAPVFIGR